MVENTSGIDLYMQQNIFIGLVFLCVLLFILILIFRENIFKKNEKTDFNDLNRSFDELKYQFSKGLTIDDYKNGIRYFEFEKVKEWKSRFGYVFSIYGNDHFIDNKPHFHFDHKEKGVYCKISFDGEIFESKGKNEIDKKALKELRYFLSINKTQQIIISKWNEKNPKLKYKI